VDLPPSEDNRKDKRIQRRFILRVAVFFQKPLVWSYVTIRNLSAGGILFAYDRSVAVGSLLVFRIDFPDRVIECMGKVVRVERGPQGVFSNVAANFQGMDQTEKDYITGFVAAYKPGLERT
jgi:hypothetical protein